MKILHVEAGKHLYGGARQVQYITEGLAARGIDSLLACPIDSEMSRQPPAGVRVLPIRMGGDADIGLVFRVNRSHSKARNRHARFRSPAPPRYGPGRRGVSEKSRDARGVRSRLRSERGEPVRRCTACGGRGTQRSLRGGPAATQPGVRAC